MPLLIYDNLFKKIIIDPSIYGDILLTLYHTGHWHRTSHWCCQWTHQPSTLGGSLYHQVSEYSLHFCNLPEHITPARHMQPPSLLGGLHSPVFLIIYLSIYISILELFYTFCLCGLYGVESWVFAIYFVYFEMGQKH